MKWLIWKLTWIKKKDSLNWHCTNTLFRKYSLNKSTGQILSLLIECTKIICKPATCGRTVWILCTVNIFKGVAVILWTAEVQSSKDHSRSECRLDHVASWKHGHSKTNQPDSVLILVIIKKSAQFVKLHHNSSQSLVYWYLLYIIFTTSQLKEALQANTQC